MSDNTYSPKVYKKDGGNTLVVASGGVLDFESGSSVTGASGLGYIPTVPSDGTYVLHVSSGTPTWASSATLPTVDVTTTFSTDGGSSIGLYGATPVTQPASANEAAVGSIAPDLSGWNGSTDPTSAQATAINAAISALKTLVNQLRSDLVAVGIIKGAA